MRDRTGGLALGDRPLPGEFPVLRGFLLQASRIELVGDA